LLNILIDFFFIVNIDTSLLNTQLQAFRKLYEHTIKVFTKNRNSPTKFKNIVCHKLDSRSVTLDDYN